MQTNSSFFTASNIRLGCESRLPFAYIALYRWMFRHFVYPNLFSLTLVGCVRTRMSVCEVIINKGRFIMCIKHVITYDANSHNPVMRVCSECTVWPTASSQSQQMNTKTERCKRWNQPNSTRVIYYYILAFPYIYLLDDYIHQ